jgi:hypothetical protein
MRVKFYCGRFTGPGLCGSRHIRHLRFGSMESVFQAVYFSLEDAVNFVGDFSQFLRIVFYFRVLAQFLVTVFVPRLHTNLGRMLPVFVHQTGRQPCLYLFPVRWRTIQTVPLENVLCFVQ